MRKLLFIALLLPTIARAEPSFSDLQSLLKARSEARPQTSFTVGQGLKILSQDPQFKQLFESYTLAKNSGSLQKSSPESPRAIMFTDTAKLVVTFNADKSQRGGQSLETVDFDEKTYNIGFREIIFKDEIDKTIRKNFAGGNLKNNPTALHDNFGLYPDEIEFENGKIAATVANPSKCLLCHGFINQHYIWDSYDIWPTMFGEIDDKPTVQELADLHTFKQKGLAGHDRYQYLKGNDNAIFPYGQGIEFSGPFNERPNLRLGQFLTIRESKNLAKTLTSMLKPSEVDQLVHEIPCQLDSFQTKLAILGVNMQTIMHSDQHPPQEPEDFFPGDVPIITNTVNGGRDYLDSFVAQEFFRLNSKVPLVSPKELQTILASLKKTGVYPLSDAAINFLATSYNGSYFEHYSFSDKFQCHK